MTTPILGMDIRIDEKGRLQPWRAVLSTLERPSRHQEFLMRLPSGLRYMTPPYEHGRGDLTELPGDPDEQFKAVAQALDEMGTSQVYAASAHQEGIAATMLAWHGVSITPVKVEFPGDGFLDDPYAIGGESAHEIANIAKKLKVHQ